MHKAAGHNSSGHNLPGLAAEDELNVPGVNCLPRAESMDVNNDPRMFSNNVLLKRLGAFQLISVCAVLMANLSCGQMLAMESKKYTNWTMYVAFCIMAVCFLFNLFTVVVLVQQMFHMYRLVTAGPTGFEMGKSYYLNPNIVSLRHLATKLFFIAIPLFLGTIGLTIYVHLGDQYVRSIPVLCTLILLALTLWFIQYRTRRIFEEKYMLAKRYEKPLLEHMKETEQRGSHVLSHHGYNYSD